MNLALDDKNTHYIIISAYIDGISEESNIDRTSLLEDSLYRRDYSVINITGMYNDKYEKSFLAFKDKAFTNNDYRYDAIELLDQFSQESCIVKYQGEKLAKKVLNDGSEKLMELIDFNNIDYTKNYSYIYNSIVFSFKENKRYFYLKDKSQLKKDMVVEYLNDNKIWVERIVKNPELEYENMYKLLMKYERLRYI